MTLRLLAAAPLTVALTAAAAAPAAAATAPACKDGGWAVAYTNQGRCVSDAGTLLDPVLLCATRPETCTPPG